MTYSLATTESFNPGMPESPLATISLVKTGCLRPLYALIWSENQLGHTLSVIYYERRLRKVHKYHLYLATIV